MDMAGTEDTELDMVMRGPIMFLTARFVSNNDDDHHNHYDQNDNDDHHHYHHQITYDVVTEEQCATHSVPECATVVRQVPEQVSILIVIIIVIDDAS